MKIAETETERLKIKKISMSDLDDLSLVLSDPAVMVYSTVGVHTRAQIEVFIENCVNRYKTLGYAHWAVYHAQTNEFVGVCGLNKHTVDDSEVIHITYRLAIKHQGKGYATEAAKGVLEYAKNSLNLKAVSAIIAPENQSSLNVVKRLGFEFKNNTSFLGFNVGIYEIEVWEITGWKFTVLVINVVVSSGLGLFNFTLNPILSNISNIASIVNFAILLFCYF